MQYMVFLIHGPICIGMAKSSAGLCNHHNANIRLLSTSGTRAKMKLSEFFFAASILKIRTYYT